jgi:hypothetical protein
MTRCTHARRRPGVSILELLVGFAILAFGVIPLYQMFTGSRQRVDTSREMLRLQAEALQILGQGRNLVASGALPELDEEQEELLRQERNGVVVTARLSRLAGGRMVMVFARAEGFGRFYETFQVVSDPFTSFASTEEDT